MKKESMKLKNYELPQKMITDLTRLSELSGNNMSDIVRTSLRIHLRKELRKYKD